MRRTFNLILAILLTSSMAFAQEMGDTIKIQKADSVIVTSDSESMSVEVFGKDGDSAYHLSKTLELGNGGVKLIREYNSEFDFKIPFTKSSEDTSGSLEFSFAPTTTSIGLVSGQGTFEGIDFNFGKSVEITWHAFHLKVKLKNSPWHFSSGLWFNWKNYRMTGNKRFDKQVSDVVLIPYDEGCDGIFSRIHTLSYQFPLLVNYQPHKNLKLAAGFLLNLNGHGNLKTRYYDQAGIKHKDRDRNVHLNSFTTDIFGVISFRNYLGVYIKYSPCDVLDTNFGPKFHSLSAGLLVNW